MIKLINLLRNNIKIKFKNKTLFNLSEVFFVKIYKQKLNKKFWIRQITESQHLILKLYSDLKTSNICDCTFYSM